MEINRIRTVSVYDAPKVYLARPVERVRKQKESRILVLENMGLAYYFAQEMRLSDPDFWEDLRQVALLALVEASKRFDPNLGQFATLARIITKQRMVHFMYKVIERNIISSSEAKTYRQFIVFCETFFTTNKRDPNVDDLMAYFCPNLGPTHAHCRTNREKYIRFLAYRSGLFVHTSLQTTVDEVSGETLEEVIPSDEPTPEEKAVSREQFAALQAAIEKLPPQERSAVVTYLAYEGSPDSLEAKRLHFAGLIGRGQSLSEKEIAVIGQIYNNSLNKAIKILLKALRQFV